MPTNEARKVDSWDEEVTDVAPKQVDSWDEEVVDEPVKKKVTPSPSQTQSSSNGLNLLSGVIPSGKALLTGQKGESVQIDQKPIDLTNAPIAEDESTRTDKFIRKPIDKKKVDEIYNLSKQNESLIDEFAKSHFVLDNLSQSEAIKQLNDLYAKREQAKDPQTAQAIDTQIEVIKSQPVEKQPSIQEAVLQNAQKYGSQPQDFNRPEIPMNPLTPNQILERNGMKTANTVGELHDRYIESATKLNELRPELDRTATELDAFKKEARTTDFKTDKSGNKTLEGLADIPEAFGHGFGGTMKSIEQGFVNLLGDKQDRIDYAKKRYIEDNILYPTRTKGMATSGAEMVGGVAPYVISTAVLPETALLGHVITNGLTMGASGYGNGYYEMFAKQKQQGASDEEADAVAMQNAKFEGAKETAIGASLPFMGGAGAKLFLAPAEKSAMKQFLATQGVIIPTFTAGKLASNVYQKYGLGEKDVNLGDGLAETAENGLILGAMMEFAHKAPPKLKELYRANLSEQYPSIQQSVDKAVKDGVMDASQGYAFTEKLKRDFAVFNAMPKDITTEQKLAIEPEVKQIIELSSREPSAVENPEVTKDKIVQLQKQVAEKLGTPLTEKEMKSYEKLQEIKGDKEDKLTPSEKLELKHYEKRIKTAEENEVKLAEEKKKSEVGKETVTETVIEKGVEEPKVEVAKTEVETPTENMQDVGVEEHIDGDVGNLSIDEKIKYISDKTGINLRKSKNTNSWYGNINGKEVRISDHPSKFVERGEQQGVPAIDLNLEYLHHDAIVHLLNDTNPFENYKKGDKITHSSDKIGEVTYLDSDYKKGYVEVETKDGRVVKYDANKFLGNEYKEQPKSTWQQEQDAIDSDAALTNEQKQEKKVEVTAKALEGADKIEINKKQAILNAEKIDKGSGSHVKKMSLGELNELARDMISNEKYYQDKLQDAQGVYNLAVERIQELSESYHKAKADGSNPELVKAVESLLSKEQPTPQQPTVTKEGFTEGKDLNNIFSGLKQKYGDKKGSILYDTAIRLINPNKNTIVEIRGNGVVVKEGEKYILKPFGNTDANPKQWTLYKGLDVTDQFAIKEQPTVSETPPALRDVESTAKALEGVDKEKGKNLLQGLINEFTGKDYFYHGTTKAFSKFKKSKKMGVEAIETEQPIFLAQNKDAAEPFSVAKGGRLLRVKVSNDVKLFDPDKIITDNNPIEYDYSNLTDEAKKLAEAFDRGEIELTLGKLKDKDGYEIISDYIQYGDWDVLESKGLKEWFIKNGYDGVFVREFRNTKDKNLAIFNTDKLIINEPQSISQAYHKAKADGSNPELVKAVEELLSPTKEENQTTESGRLEEQKPNKEVSENPALKDVESTAKALWGVQKENADKFVNDFANIDIPFRQKNIQAEMDSEVKKQLFPNEKSRRKYAETIYSAVVRSGNFPKILSEAYHKAKADGSNPELVKAVEQSLKETTQSETKVAEKGVEEPITEEIKTAIDNGEITREQVDGFTEQDESAIEDIERKAESEDEKQRNEAIDQADKLIGEAITRSKSKTEPSNEKVEGGEVKKTLVTKRAYEGSFREGVKKELEAIGLTRETENFEKAEIEAKKFFDEYGEDVAIEAMKAKDIEGALGAFVWNEITKSIDKKLSEATDIAEIEQLQKKQAEMLDIWGKQQRSGGAFNAAMAKIYENSDLGYSYEKQKDKWEGKFGEPMPKDIAEKFKQYDTELSDLKKRITEAEKKVKEAEEKQAFDNIVAEVRQKTKTERSGRRKIAEGLDELTNALGVKLSAVGDKKASATKALIKIGEGLIEEGIATAKNVAEKIREYVEDKFKGKIDIKEYEPDVLKHFEETLPKITERNGKIHIPDKLIKDLVKNGAETIEDLVSQVKEIAKEDFPDITDREIRDSITKYGKTQNPTKDEILSKISRMKRIGRLISQLEDVQNKIRPLKSGLQRERMDAEERAMNKQLREELRNLPVDEETLAGQIRTVLDARKQGVQNRIEDLQREIEQGEKTPKNQRTIADDEALTKLKEQLEKVKAEHQEKFAEQNEAEKEAKRLSMAKKNTQKRIEDLTTRLREGNFSKVAKKEIKEDAELTKLRAEKIRIQEEFDKEFHKQELLNKKGVEKLKDRLWEIWSLPRALMATGEMSFVGVQGLINTIAHPIESAKALKRAFEFAFSEKKTEQWLNEIKSQEYYPIMKKSKLSLTEPNAELTAREELFYSGWTNMIWDALGKPLKLKSDSAHERWKELNPMRGVERASVGYLDTQRVSRFLDGMEMLKQKGITYEENPQAYKDVADVVNTFTGRASLGKLEMIAPTLSKIFFSPRNWASALKTATPYALYHFGKMRADADGFKPSTAQKMAISDLSKFVGVTTSMVMMAAATLNSDDDESTGVEFDPRSSDFMKIKISDKRIDPWGGKIQQIIFSSRVLMDALHEASPSLSEGGYKKKDEVMPLGVKYKSPTLASLSATQATNKLAPTMALLNRYASTEIGKDGKRKDAFGNEFELSDEAVKMLKPIYWGTVGELLKEDPSALNGLLAFYAFFGGGVNIYGKKKEKKKD